MKANRVREIEPAVVAAPEDEARIEREHRRSRQATIFDHDPLAAAEQALEFYARGESWRPVLRHETREGRPSYAKPLRPVLRDRGALAREALSILRASREEDRGGV